MNRRRSHWLNTGATVATGLVGIILGIVTLNGFQGSGSGDLVVSSTMGSGVSLALVLAGTLALLSLDLAHATSRRKGR
jgi:hypothetical protein